MAGCEGDGSRTQSEQYFDNNYDETRQAQEHDETLQAGSLNGEESNENSALQAQGLSEHSEITQPAPTVREHKKAQENDETRQNGSMNNEEWNENFAMESQGWPETPEIQPAPTVSEHTEAQENDDIRQDGSMNDGKSNENSALEAENEE